MLGLVLKISRVTFLDFALPASHLLCDFLIWLASCGNNNFSELHLVELGAGAGLCGVLASHFTPNCLLTDRDTASLDLCRRNFDLNRDGMAKMLIQQPTLPAVKPLTWGNDKEIIEVGRAAFEVVFGSDIVYPSTSDDSIEALFYTVDALLLDENKLGIRQKDQKLPIPCFVLSYISRDGKATTRRLFQRALHCKYDCESIDPSLFACSIESKQGGAKLLIFKKVRLKSGEAEAFEHKFYRTAEEIFPGLWEEDAPADVEEWEAPFSDFFIKIRSMEGESLSEKTMLS